MVTMAEMTPHPDALVVLCLAKYDEHELCEATRTIVGPRNATRGGVNGSLQKLSRNKTSAQDSRVHPNPSSRQSV